MLTELQPEKGRLLISEPFLPDPNFFRSVVLIAEHGNEGSLGFVLNNKSGLILSDLMPDIKNANFPIYIGGPVETDSLFFIHTVYDQLLSGEEISKGVFWGGNFEALKILIEKEEISQTDIRFLMGYSGWSEGQLISELKQNSWMVTNKYTAEILFTSQDADLWKKILGEMGSRFAHVGNFPADPNLN